MKQRRVCSIFLSVLVLCGCLTACSSDGKGEADAKEPVIQEMRDLTAQELVDELVIGWNLGNTLDATGNSGLDTETSWGNPVTTAEMIQSVAEQGFNVVRLPITWTGHMGEAPDYQIDTAWMDRVQEVVDYVIDADLYCIINLHHEDWHFPSYDNLESAKTQLTAVWTQIADRFQGYDEHLIFEGMNEPRMVGTDLEWSGGNAEAWDVINQLNAAFLETVRSAPGNNPKRCVMIPTYAASVSTNVCNNFLVPDDDRVIVSAHLYKPYNFALNKLGTDQFDPATDTSEIDWAFQMLEEYYLARGIPVIVGEFGALNKSNNEERVEWVTYYLEKATATGIPCIWWDNGAFTGNGENFGLYQRSNQIWMYQELVDAMMEAVADRKS